MARFGPPPGARFGAISVPMSGEVDCGDAWHLVSDGEQTALMVADGLGHGTFAAEAAQAAIGAFASAPYGMPQDVLVKAGDVMTNTRGGAAACALVRGNRVSYAGVGNISGVLVSAEKSQGLVSHAGTLGMKVRRTSQFEYQRANDALLVMHSDGLSARWNLRDRPGLLQRHPAIVAAVLYRDHGRERDDATVVVLA